MPGYEFVIHQKSVSCTSCDKVFATPVNHTVPDMSPTLPVDSDLHRILPYGALRASMIAVCPFCQYAWWASTFSSHYRLPIGIAEAPAINQSSKFAHAIFTGRQNNYHILDRAMLALNGYWCAQECNESINKWLALAIQELTAALAEKNWTGNRARYHYILGELLRRKGDFSVACQNYDFVDKSANLPEELCRKQKELAIAHQSHSVFLSKDQIEEIFFPDLLGDIPAEIYASRPAERKATIREMIAASEIPMELLSAPVLPSVPAKRNKDTSTSSAAWQDVRTTRIA